MNGYKLAIDALHYSGLARLMRGRCAGVGALLTLHHVRPRVERPAFSPNRILEITPEFLDDAICELRRLGYEFVSLDEFHARMTGRDFGQRFVSLTLDDGYVDNYQYAFPVFKRHGVPFCIYICTGIMDGTAQLWWLELEAMILHREEFRTVREGKPRVLTTRTPAEKYAAFNSIYWGLRAMPHELQLETMQMLRDENGLDPAWSRVEPLSWTMVEEMQESGLLTIGAHTVNHYALSKLSSTALYEEIDRSRAEIAQHTQIVSRHFAYPYGDSRSAGEREFRAAKDLGFLTAVTTRKGVVAPEQALQLHGVPRISLNGDYQILRYLRVLMTGVPFALYRSVHKAEATY